MAIVVAAAGTVSHAQQVQPITNFGTVNVGSTSTPQTVTFTGLPQGVSVFHTVPSDFSLDPTCDASGRCTVVVTFTPRFPGLRVDGVQILNQQGSLIGIAEVYGIGNGPQAQVEPAILSTVANRANNTLSTAILNGVATKATQVFFSDNATHRVYSLDTVSGILIAIAGNGTQGYSGDGGSATTAQLNGPSALAFDAAGDLYIADTGNNVIRRVRPDGGITTVAGSGAAGNSGDGAAATSAQLNAPMGVAVDVEGNLYIADTGNNRIREVAAAKGQITSSAQIVNFAGSASGTVGWADGAATAAGLLSGPMGLAVDASGNLFIADSNNSVVREVSGGNLSTVAGVHNNASYGGDGGVATSAFLNSPTGVSVDAGGSLYIADEGNNRIREVSGDSAHVITTIAGGGATGYNGDGGPATSASLHTPTAVAVDDAGSLYFVDSLNYALRELNATNDSRHRPIATPAALSFPSAGGGALTVTVANTGNAPLLFSALSITAPYTQSGGTCTTTTSLSAGANCTIALSLPGGSTPGPSASLTITDNSLNQSGAQQAASLSLAAGLRFVPIPPCRVVDTRNVGDTFSGTYLKGGLTRSYVIPASPNISGCAGVTIPSTARAYSLNLAVIPHSGLVFLSLSPQGQTQYSVSTLNSYDNRIKSNAAIVGADSNGGISVYASNDTEVVLDVDGYFVSSADSSYSSDYEFFPMTPCRVVDTRGANGALGGPAFGTHSSRIFPVLSSPCSANIPSNVKAYSLNIGAAPSGGHPLVYLTAWPTGAPQPLASILNATTGTIVSNAAIVPAGTSGSVSVYASDPTDVVVDINGYFAAPSNGLSLYTVTPCRVLDTRELWLNIGPGTLPVDFVGSSCNVPAGAQAYVTNATVLPQSSFSYLALWPEGEVQPLASVLNALDGFTTSNMAIVPTTNGTLWVYAASATSLILDISGYFAP